MFSVPFHLIVVGVTEKSYNHNHPLWETLEYMDSEEKEHSSDNNGGKVKSYKEPVIQIVKSSTTNNILPSVHSTVAAASPIFSSYRSVFQNWKHSVPKLYKYPSSDIEVVVYRKNGEIEKLTNHSHKDDTTKTSKCFEAGENATVKNNVSKPTSSDKDGEGTALEKRLDETTFMTIDDDHDKHKGGETVLESSDKDIVNINKAELSCVPLETNDLQYSSLSSCSGTQQVPDESTDNNKLMFSKSSSPSKTESTRFDHSAEIHHHQNDYKQGKTCEFIFHVKTRPSVPSLGKRQQTEFKENYTQTMTVNTLITSESEAKGTQIFSGELVALKNAENQCDLDKVHYATNSTQTNVQSPQKTLDFGQTFPIVLNTFAQTEEFGIETLSSTTQTNDNRNLSPNHMTNLPLHTVDWHMNVPCCNASNQTDPSVFNLVKENCCQAVPEVTSNFSQVESNDVLNTKANATTNTDLETREIGVQLSASCCYFTKKRERRRYEKKLDVVRKEIRHFFQKKWNHPDLPNVNVVGSGAGNSMNSVECSPEGGNHLDTSSEATTETTMENATKYLEELGNEVDSLLGNASLLKSNVDSLEESSYYEDDWLLSNN